MSDRPASSLPAILVVTGIGSFSTGVFWNAIPFIAKHGYEFSEVRNALLFGAMGVVYMTGAATSGRMTRGIGRRLSLRAMLAIIMVLQSLLALLPVLVASEWALWAAVVSVSWLMSLMWPIVEVYVSSGRHGADMRRAIGWFNIVWMTTVFLPMFAIAPILEHHAPLAIGLLGVVNLGALFAIPWFGREPEAHDADETAQHVGAEYSPLLRSARVLLPLSYVFNAAIGPVVPYRLEVLDVAPEWETPITATWMVMRLAIVIWMSRVAAWHGRWGVLLASGLAMTAGFALMVTAPFVSLMMLGFALFGMGMGTIYFAALYYGMAVGHAQVDAGGTHEALIGSGYVIGPAAVMGGHAIAGTTTIAAPWAIVGMVWGVAACAAGLAVRPYVKARRGRH